MIVFYAPDVETTGILPESDSAHCCRVLRMKEGDEITVTDGKGHRFLCKIVEAHQKRTAVEIIGREDVPNHWKVPITLAVAPTKLSDRMEWMLEKVVEIGIDRVVLLRCRHSERKVIKTERLEKVMVSAMKQSLKGVLPEITEMTDFKDFIAECKREGARCADGTALASAADGVAPALFMGYCDSAYPRREFVKECRRGVPVTIMIGPEGDFSPEEVAMAVEAGFLPVTFGESRLRTETAALYGVTAVHILNQLD